MLLCLRRDEIARLGWGRLLAVAIFPRAQPRQFLPARKPSPADVRPTIPGVLLDAAAAALLLWVVPRLLPEQTPLLVRAWVGIVGMALIVLFVRFDVVVLLFRWLGFAVEKFFDCPIAATSLAEFWGGRWNRIMSALLRDVLFLPLSRRVGTIAATGVVFFASGVLHETIAIRGGTGYGGPTLYFLIQGAGVLIENRGAFRRTLRRKPWLGRAWTAAFVVGPLALLFHPQFVLTVMVPMLREMHVPGLDG
jgi:hypothetical protein